ncbi:unnamed protein product [Paramecium primaurelia]|uniref:Uncharacterized protein n=1 Tax=Paramecium primaurelia TaxID=5886 RepID=A0A8S1K579_PARPR|nr:unnamed protein product [Paramecium primaurelia]
MYNDKTIYIVEQLIQDANSDLVTLLQVETFMKYVRVSDAIAIEFIIKNINQLLRILFINYDQIHRSQYIIYSDLISIVWEIIDLNIEQILQQIENNSTQVYDLLNYQNVPDVQWAQAHKFLQFIKQRSWCLIPKALFEIDYLLIKFLPHLHNKSVALIILLFFENQYHDQQLSFLKKGFNQFNEFDPCTAINFTFLIHEIITRIATKELINFLLSSQAIAKSFEVLENCNLSFIVRKNAAHILSLISNYYSLDMQNLYLDEPSNETIIDNFRQTEFYQTFNIQIIKDILNNVLLNNCRLGLLAVKLIEIVDNLVRISDLELWNKIDKSNIMEIILNLVKKFKNSDIFISYVNNMIIFILDRAISDFHPFWCVQIFTKYKLYAQQIMQFNRQILIFEQQLQVKLIRDSDFLPYYNELMQIENILKRSQFWRQSKEQLQKYEEKHIYRLGEDSDTPSIDYPLIVSAIDDECIDEIIEPKDNIFIDCLNRQSPIDSLNNNDDSDDDDKLIGAFSGLDTLNKLKNVFHKMDLKDQEENQQVQENKQQQQGKRIRNLSNSLNNQIQQGQRDIISRSLNSDHDSLQKLSLSSSTNLKLMTKTFDSFTIEILGNTKVVKNNQILKVDEIDNTNNIQNE